LLPSILASEQPQSDLPIAVVASKHDDGDATTATATATAAAANTSRTVLIWLYDCAEATLQALANHSESFTAVAPPMYSVGWRNGGGAELVSIDAESASELAGSDGGDAHCMGHRRIRRCGWRHSGSTTPSAAPSKARSVC
jgi:hypothetical protein